MNITKENFESAFETLCEAIRTSHFIALDAEFTGLRLPGAPKEKMTDSIQARYALARSSCSQFMLTQYGICCFRYDDSHDRLEARPFNCYVVPSTKFGSDRVYSCQASSMDFLSNHGFDFQSWASHGVPFLSRAEEEAIKERLHRRWEREATAAAEKKQAAAAAAAAGANVTDDGGAGAAAAVERPVHTSSDGTTIESLEEPEKGMVKDALTKVEALLAESSSGGKYVQKSTTLEPMNGRQRWLMHEFVASSTPYVKLSNLKGPSFARPMEIRTVSKDPEQETKVEAELRADEQARQLRDLQKAAGFRRVVDEIFQAKKPVVCHNGLLDLLHTHDKFVGPIPKDLDAGTRTLHSLIPCLFDSQVVMAKAISAGMRFPRTVLGEAHRWLRETFPAPRPPPPQEGAGSGAEPMEPTANEQPDGTAGMMTSGKEANGDCAMNAEAAEEVTPPVSEGPAGPDDWAGAEAMAVTSALERARRGWDAVFAPGFEERYKDGGQEHEAGFDAYLTGCCFAAAATVGLGVRVDELKRMASGGETPVALVSVQNTVHLHRVFGGMKICLPGPAPPVDLSHYVHISGFPPAARTDAILGPIKAVDGCEETWFYWIDDTSGVADCKSAEGAKALLEAAAAAAASACGRGVVVGNGEPSSPRVVDPCQLSLEDFKAVQMDYALLNGASEAAEEVDAAGEGKLRETKRSRQEGEEGGEKGSSRRTRLEMSRSWQGMTRRSG